MILLVAIGGAQVFLRSFLLKRRAEIATAVLTVIFSSLLVLAFAQYHVWQINPIGKFLLPPYQDISYALFYIFQRIIFPWIFSAIAGVAVAFAALRLNKKFQERFFEAEEPFIIGVSIFLCGYPGFLFYIVFMGVTGVLLSLVYLVLKKERAPLYHFWIPIALSAIIISNYVLHPDLTGKFNI